jgi:cysteine-rich repeat protein
MKKSVLIVSIIFLASLVSAVNSCSNPDQIILRLSGSTNAHGEIWNGIGNYGEEICYNQIFSDAPLLPTPKSCKAGGANTVLKLSGDTNAHAEGPSGARYATDICYGDLNCRLTSSCSAGEVAIVQLSSATNAHLETTSSGNYGQTICCSSTAAPDPGCDPSCDSGTICSVGSCVTPPSPPSCGDGSIGTGEQCDGIGVGADFGGKTCNDFVPGSGGSLSCDECIIDASSCGGGGGPVCGDGSIGTGEQCDDGDIIDGDGCDSNCQEESGYDCNGEPSVCIPGSPSTGSAYWAEEDDTTTAVTDGFNVLLRQRIALIAMNAPANEVVTFDIFDADCFLGSPPCGGDDFIKSVSANSDVSGKAVAVTSFDLLDYEKGEQGDATPELELYFVAKSENYEEQSSNTIKLFNEEIKIVVIDTEGCAQFDEQKIECEDANNADPAEAVWRFDEQSQEEELGTQVGGVGCENMRTDGSTIKCECLYDDSKEKCGFNWYPDSAEPPPGGGPGDICIGSCFETSSQGTCEDNLAILTYNTEFNGIGCNGLGPFGFTNKDDQTQCSELNDREESVLCGFAPSLILPFFSFMQFYISVGLFVVIYLFLLRKRRI